MDKSRLDPLPVSLLQRMPRMLGWLLVALTLIIVVWLVAPQQLPVSLYKLSLVSMAAVAGYWLDRSLFPYARPDRLFDLDSPFERLCDGGPLSRAVLAGLAMFRRACIVAAAMLAMGLGA